VVVAIVVRTPTMIEARAPWIGAGVDVAALVVEAEGIAPVGARGLVEPVERALLGVDGREQLRRDGHRHEHDDEHGGHPEQRAPAELPPGVLGQGPAWCGLAALDGVLGLRVLRSRDGGRVSHG
jgi:hypothetical protein